MGNRVRYLEIGERLEEIIGWLNVKRYHGLLNGLKEKERESGVLKKPRILISGLVLLQKIVSYADLPNDSIDNLRDPDFAEQVRRRAKTCIRNLVKGNPVLRTIYLNFLQENSLEQMGLNDCVFDSSELEGDRLLSYGGYMKEFDKCALNLGLYSESVMDEDFE